MKRFILGFIVCLILELILVAGLLIYPVIKTSHPRFAIATGGLPELATQQINRETVGFDIYTNPKARPVLKKETKLPIKKTTSWSTSSCHDGHLHLRETIWLEYLGQLYQIGHFDKEYDISPNQYLAMSKTFSIGKERQINVRVLLPEIDVDETFGPFGLP